MIWGFPATRLSRLKSSPPNGSANARNPNTAQAAEESTTDQAVAVDSMGFITATLALITSPVWIPLLLILVVLGIVLAPLLLLLSPLLILIAVVTHPFWVPLLILAILL